MMIKKKFLGLGLTILFLLIQYPLHGGVYKWVDANGVTRYTDKIPPGAQEASGQAPVPQPKGPKSLSEIATHVGFDLAGKVQDAQGHPISGVTMTIIENHPRPNTFEFTQKRRNETVNGSFHIVCDGCPIHRLRFRAPGYLSEEYDIKATPAEEHHINQQAMAAMTGKPNRYSGKSLTVVRDKILIVMQPESSVVRLTRIEAMLRTVEQGPLTVIRGQPPAIKQRPARAFTKEPAPAPGEAVIALVPGEFSFSYFADAGAQNTLHTLDTPLYIELQDVDGGFVPADPGEGRLRDRWDSLTEAPESGYQKQLPVPTHDPYTRGTFFYFKIGDLYGKGSVTAVNYHTIRDNAVLNAGITLYLNPSGSRNLASRVW